MKGISNTNKHERVFIGAVLFKGEILTDIIVFDKDVPMELIKDIMN